MDPHEKVTLATMMVATLVVCLWHPHQTWYILSYGSEIRDIAINYGVCFIQLCAVLWDHCKQHPRGPGMMCFRTRVLDLTHIPLTHRLLLRHHYGNAVGNCRCAVPSEPLSFKGSYALLPPVDRGKAMQIVPDAQRAAHIPHSAALTAGSCAVSTKIKELTPDVLSGPFFVALTPPPPP